MTEIPRGATVGMAVAARLWLQHGASRRDFLALAEVAWDRAHDDGSTVEHPRTDGSYGYPQGDLAAARLVGSPEEQHGKEDQEASVSDQRGEPRSVLRDLQSRDERSDSQAEVAPGDGRIADAVLRIRMWLVQSGRYTASTIELDRVLHLEIQAALSGGGGRAARLQALLAPFMRRWMDNPNASSYLWTLVEAYEPELPRSSRRREMLNAVRRLEELARTLGGQPEGQ